MQKLRERRVKRIAVVCTHALFTGPAIARLRAQTDIAEIVTTDTVPIPIDRRLPNMSVLSVAPLLSEAIHRIHAGRSVSSLFDVMENGAEEMSVSRPGLTTAQHPRCRLTSPCPRPSTDANRAAEFNIAYQQALADWKALPFLTRLRTDRHTALPESPPCRRTNGPDCQSARVLGAA